MKCNYQDKNAQSEFDSLSVDEKAKGVQTENYGRYGPISLRMQAGWDGGVFESPNLSLFEHQFTFKPVAKSWCIF